METTTIHPAEAYLRNAENPPSLYVRIAGKRRRLFINRDDNIIGIVAPGKRKKGYVFASWSSIEKIYEPSQKQETNTERRHILKYQRLAKLATHTNAWLRKIAKADLEKSLYENRITTGTLIDGKCIRLSTIEEYCGRAEMRLFREAVKQGKQFSTARFDFCGYDGRLWCEPRENGDVMAGFDKEYRLWKAIHNRYYRK